MSDAQIESDGQSVGAMVKSALSDGRTLHRPFVKGEGLCSDSTPIITLGTGGADITSVDILFLDGTIANGETSGVGCTITVDEKGNSSAS